MSRKILYKALRISCELVLATDVVVLSAVVLGTITVGLHQNGHQRSECMRKVDTQEEGTGA